MHRDNRELWAAFIAILLITALYFTVVVLLDDIPHSSDLFGHLIGVLGFILMLMTEILYTWRKRSSRARWGRMANWLNFHIFTGIVGPYMVLLHTAWHFNGLAGLTLLLTAIVVASGFIGRYIYTAVPRSADGVEIEAAQLEDQIAAVQAELQDWLRARPEAGLQLYSRLTPGIETAGAGSASTVFERGLLDWRQRLDWRRFNRRLDPAMRAQARQLEGLIQRQQTLRRQVDSLAMARRLLALWHTVHVPIGMMLFTAAFIHIIAAFYYATLLR